MEKSKDILFLITAKPDLSSLLKLSCTNSRINKSVDNDNIWRYKILKDYLEFQKFSVKKVISLISRKKISM